MFMGLKTEIIPKKDQRRRKREIVRGKTTKIPPSEKLFPSTDEPSLFGNICIMMEMLEPAEDKIGMTQKIHLKLLCNYTFICTVNKLCLSNWILFTQTVFSGFKNIFEQNIVIF